MDGKRRAHLEGLALAKAGDMRGALAAFEAAHAAYPDDPGIGFSLGQHYGALARPEAMFALFDRFTFPKVPADLALAQARLAWLFERADKALAYLAPAGAGDGPAPWGARVALLDELGRLEDARAGARTDEQKLLVACLAGGGWRPYLEMLEANIRSLGATVVPDGYAILRLAALRAKLETDPRKSADILDGVRFTRGDLPWLEDMKLLLLCELARATGDARSEEVFLHDLLARQPLLFELHYALDFNALAYQRALRGLVRRNLEAKAA